MSTIFRYTLTRFRGQILGWSIAMVLLAMLIVPLYDVVLGQQAQFQELLKSYPPEMSAFFGDISQLGTPEGYLSVEFFSITPLILGVFAVLIGSGLLAGDEEKGTLDLVLAHPVSRAGLFWGRVLAFVAATVIILAITWLSFLVLMTQSSLDVGSGAMALPFLSLLGVLLCFGTLALLFSLLLPSRRLAAMVAGLLLIASYFLTSLARINADLRSVARLSPLNYYQSGDAILGLNVGWLLALLATALVWTLLAWWRFERRDIRVGGEGGWKLPALPWRRGRARGSAAVRG